QQALLRELFLAPVGPRLALVLTSLLRALFDQLDPAERENFLDAALNAFYHLECKGMTAEAGALATLAADLGLASYPGQVLPLLCAWSRLQLRNIGFTAAEATARSAQVAAQALADPSPGAEATACLADALYKSGQRREAAALLRPVAEGNT